MYCTSKCCDNLPYGRVPIRRPGLDEEEKVEEERRLAEERDKWVMREPEKAERAVELKAAKRRKKRDGGVSGLGPGICLYCTALTCNTESTYIIGYI